MVVACASKQHASTVAVSCAARIVPSHRPACGGVPLAALDWSTLQLGEKPGLFRIFSFRADLLLYFCGAAHVTEGTRATRLA